MRYELSRSHISKLGTHYFLPGAQHSQFSKAHVERGALESPVRLSDHDHIDAARQRGLIEPLVQLLHRHQHLTRQLPHVVHGVHLPVKTLTLTRKRMQPLSFTGRCYTICEGEARQSLNTEVLSHFPQNSIWLVVMIVMDFLNYFGFYLHFF